MLERFNRYIQEKSLFGKTDYVIAGVSGGLDSVCLCYLLYQAGYNFGIAHCNFGLRGEESDEDERFVKELADKYKAPFYVRSFETEAYARREKISIQMAARTLRYEWFERLLKENGGRGILTAHHHDDSVETFFLNLIRGTGIAGLHGIQPVAGKIVRPLLFASREELKALTKKAGLDWREDSSNQSVKYKRNFLRHKVIPLFSEVNPNFANTFRETLAKLSLTEAVFMESVEAFRRKAFKVSARSCSIAIEELRNNKNALILLYETLKSFQFNFDQCVDMLNCLDAEAGKRFESASHVLVKDRLELIITQKSHADSPAPVLIREDQAHVVVQGYSLQITRWNHEQYELKRSADSAAFDFDKLRFPLVVRRWKQGDYFFPLGMNGKKKISDFLIDRKVPLNLKSEVFLLISDEQVVWVIGHRIDRRFKIGEETKRVLEVQLSLHTE